MGLGMVGPVLALAFWTMIMWVWMYVTRIPAMQAAKIDPNAIANTGLKGLLPAKVEQVANNYNHLHEQPTVFYAAALAIAVGGLADATLSMLAWTYVGLRVLHSIWQATVNGVPVRFLLFAASSLALMAMITLGALKMH